MGCVPPVRWAGFRGAFDAAGLRRVKPRNGLCLGAEVCYGWSYSGASMNHRIKFAGVLPGKRKRPGLGTWLLVFAILFAACFIPVINLVAFALLVLLVPAAVGSFCGWFIGGVRGELRTVRQLWKRRRV